jgi:hypothetical protein
MWLDPAAVELPTLHRPLHSDALGVSANMPTGQYVHGVAALWSASFLPGTHAVQSDAAIVAPITKIAKRWPKLLGMAQICKQAFLKLQSVRLEIETTLFCAHHRISWDKTLHTPRVR